MSKGRFEHTQITSALTQLSFWSVPDRSGLNHTDMTEDRQKPQRRVFPPLYKSSGNLASDRLAFFHVLERLKVRLTIIQHD
jgi:hypothetical protein